MQKRQSQKLATFGSPVKPHKFNIIVYEHVELQSKEDIETVAKEIMGRAMESAECGTVGERATYGNQKGRDLLEDMHNTETMKRLEDWMAEKDAEINELGDRMAEKDTEINELGNRMAKKDTQISYHQAQLAESQAQITSLQNRVHGLTADAEGYYDIRHRFIDVYRRDIRKDDTEEVRARIKKGNGKAYEGDVIVDAQLYTTGRRFDKFALVDLYGLDSNQISLLPGADGYSSIINTLNAGAAWRKKGPARIPVAVAVAFQAFIAELRADPNQKLTDETTALNRAYCAFWAANGGGPR